MKDHLKHLGLGVTGILIIMNAYFFVKTIVLGDNLLKMETEIKRLKTENAELEKKLSSLNSLGHLKKVAAHLGFTQKSALLYLDNLQYALRYE